MSEVVLETHEGWAELILNRPASRNAIDGPLGIRLAEQLEALNDCLLYTSPSPRDQRGSRMPSSA